MSKQSLAAIIIVLLILIRCFIVEPNSIETTRYEIRNPQLKGLRIVFLTDLHLKKHDYKRLDKIVQATVKQNPDLVLIGGDFANGHNYKSMMDIDVAAQKLTLIDKPIYAVLGEHDWWAGGKIIANGLRKNGISVLENNNKRIMIKRKYIDIIGLEDLTTRRPNIARAFMKTSLPRIVLTHNPDIYYSIMDDVTVILAGHTHGGQFIIPFMPPMFVPSKYGAEFASGMIENTHNKMIISKGLGTSVLPVRFLCKPEIVVVDFTY